MGRKSQRGKCGLCHKTTELQNSHIIPEFFYKPLYDSKHRMNAVPLTPTETAHYKQKGLREFLLCQECELKFSKYENYTRGILWGGKSILIKHGNPIIMSEIDYPTFKLFQLSLLWRASISTLDFFQNVQLGPVEERIRLMLLNEDPGDDTTYPCMIILFLRDESIPLQDLIMAPSRLKMHGHTVYRFVMGGGFWVWVASSHAERFPRLDYILRADGSINIPLKRAEETPYFQDVAKLMKSAQSENKT